jgi:hypothetical protein
LSPALTPHNGRHPTLKKLENIENKKTNAEATSVADPKHFGIDPDPDEDPRIKA